MAKQGAKRGREAAAADATDAKAGAAEGKASKAKAAKSGKSGDGGEGGKAAKAQRSSGAKKKASSAAAAAPPPVSVSELARRCHLRVAFFAFDDPSAPPPAVSFLQRYAGDYEVAPPVAAAHAAEYLRFMALKAALLLAAQAAADGGAPPAPPAPSGVTPSLAVDAVWHTHLLYSRSYARLCAALLGAAAPDFTAATSQIHFIHHDPSPGGAAAAALFTAQYAAAAALYRDAFGSPPPVQVWPPATLRFAPHSQFVSVTRGDRALLRLTMAAMAEERMHPDSDYDSDPGPSGCG